MSRVLLPTQNDEPVLESLASRHALVGQVALEIAHCSPPQVFGVHGEWGAGKTSFLSAVEKLMTGRCRRLEPQAKLQPHAACEDIRVVWFEAWRYQHEGAPVIALLHEICEQLSFAAKAQNELSKLAYAGFHGLISSIKEVAFEPKLAGVSAGKLTVNNPFSAIAASGERWEAERFAAPLTTERIRKLLDSSLKQLLGWSAGNNARVLIIIDDLDRCSPGAAYRLLEGIKIYLNLESCVFLLGINQREVVRAIGEAKSNQRRLTRDEKREGEIRGAEYLEKLCSVIWKLPVPTSKDRADLIAGFLRPPHPNDSSKLADRNPLSKELIEAIQLLLIEHDPLPANPRKIKAFANALRQVAADSVHRQLADTGGSLPPAGEPLPVPPVDAAALIIAASIYAFHPKLLVYLQAHQEFFAELCEWSRTGLTTHANDLHDVLRELDQTQYPHDPSAPTPGVGRSRFADPAYGAVFRIQRILNAVSQPPAVLYDQLRHYLHLPEPPASFIAPIVSSAAPVAQPPGSTPTQP